MAKFKKNYKFKKKLQECRLGTNTFYDGRALDTLTSLA